MSASQPTPSGSRCSNAASVELYCSDEVSGTAQGAREQADALDDSWRKAADADASGSVTGRVLEHELPVVLGYGTLVVTATLRDMSTADLANAESVGSERLPGGYSGSTLSPTMQEEAPKPQCLFRLGEAYWNEESGSESSRNAVLFEFSEPVLAFGAWFGDLETRTDGRGTAAIIRLLDSNGGRIGKDVSVETSTSNQSACGGGTGSTTAGCGSRTTRWLGFVARGGVMVARMLIVVGDDDSLPPSDGLLEHVSFIGPTAVRAGSGTGDTVPTATRGPTPTSDARTTPEPSRWYSYLPSLARRLRYGPWMPNMGCLSMLAPSS